MALENPKSQIPVALFSIYIMLEARNPDRLVPDSLVSHHPPGDEKMVESINRLIDLLTDIADGEEGVVIIGHSFRS